MVRQEKGQSIPIKMQDVYIPVCISNYLTPLRFVMKLWVNLRAQLPWGGYKASHTRR